VDSKISNSNEIAFQVNLQPGIYVLYTKLKLLSEKKNRNIFILSIYSLDSVQIKETNKQDNP